MQQALSVLVRTGPAVPEATIAELAESAGLEPSHQLFQDTELLYDECLRFALSQLWPAADVVSADSVSSAVPADAIRTLFRELFRCGRNNPQALRFIVSENLFDSAQLSRRHVPLDDSPMMLQLDRILMRGHDVGAFRAGISAEDVYVLMLSLCSFPVSMGSTFHKLYGMNATDASNTAGLEALATDAVVAFLTTPMPTSQGSSYTHSSLSLAVGPSVAATLYSREQSPAPLSRGVVSSSSDANTDCSATDLYRHE